MALVVVAWLIIGAGVSSVWADECSSFMAAGDRAAESFAIPEALEQYRRASRICPSGYETLSKLTNACIDMGEELGVGKKAVDMYRKAGAHAEQLVQQYPDSSRGYFFKALIAANLANQVGNKEKVRLSQSIEKNATRAIRLDSSFAPSYIVLGAYYREASTISGFVKGLAGLIYGEIPHASLDTAYRLLVHSLQLDSNSIYGHYEMAKTCGKMERVEEAKEHLEKVLKLPVSDHRHMAIQEKAEKLLKELSLS